MAMPYRPPRDSLATIIANRGLCYNTAIPVPTRKESAMTQADTPEYQLYLAGEWRAGTPYTVTCPYDGAPVGTVHRAGPTELELAIQAAAAAFETTRRLPGHKRAAALRKISET